MHQLHARFVTLSSPSYSLLMITFSGGSATERGNRRMTLMETRWVSWQRYKLQPPVRPQSELCLFWREQTVAWWHFWWIGRVVLCDAQVTGGGRRRIAIMHKLTDGILPCPQSGGNRVLTCSTQLIWKIASQRVFFRLYLSASRGAVYWSPADKPLQTERSPGSVLPANQIALKARFDLLQSAETRGQMSVGACGSSTGQPAPAYHSASTVRGKQLVCSEHHPTTGRERVKHIMLPLRFECHVIKKREKWVSCSCGGQIRRPRLLHCKY